MNLATYQLHHKHITCDRNSQKHLYFTTRWPQIIILESHHLWNTSIY